MNGRNVTGILKNRKVELEAQQKENKDKLSRINYYILNRKEDFSMNYQAVIKELPEVIVYSRRTVLKSYEDYFKFIPETGEIVKKANPTLKCREPEYCFNIYLDGEYKEKDIKIEFCEAVEEFGKEVEDIHFKKMQAVKAVTVMHKGSYQELGKAYFYVFKWIEDNGYQAKDKVRESYIDGIWNKENEEDWLTEIQVPLL